MPEDELDPGASTQMFQAFVDRREEPEASGSRWTWVALAVVLVIVLALAWLVLGG
jgi:flagellar biogenesis protein FliO